MSDDRVVTPRVAPEALVRWCRWIGGLLLAGSVLLAARAEPAAAKEPLRFDAVERVVEVGFYPRSYVLEFLFQVESPGAVTIQNFTSSCPCTTVAMERTRYFPGEKGLIAAIYDYRGETEPEVQAVHVVTERARPPQVLRVAPRRVAGPLWVERNELRWIAAQGSAAQRFDVEVAPELAGRELQVIATQPGWTVTVERTDVEGRQRVTVTPAAGARPAEVFLTLVETEASARVRLAPAE